MEQIDSEILTMLPPPAEIHREMGRLLRQVSMLRRLLRITQAAREEGLRPHASGIRENTEKAAA